MGFEICIMLIFYPLVCAPCPEFANSISQGSLTKTESVALSKAKGPYHGQETLRSRGARSLRETQTGLCYSPEDFELLLDNLEKI